jgi:hypothetical protein
VSRVTAAIAVAATALAAWLSQATLAFVGGGNARIAVFPLSISAAVFVVTAAGLVWLAWRRGASLAPLWLLVLIGLPWLSASAPPAFLMWSGRIALGVWAAVAAAMVASLPAGRAFRPTNAAGLKPRPTVSTGRKPRPTMLAGLKHRPLVLAGALALAINSVAAWRVAPSLLSGDEPHYLIITQSILQDHDLKIENNHRRGDYHAYLAGELPRPDYRRLGRDGQIYSIHAPGLPVLISPAFAIGGYDAVVVFLIVVVSAGSALAWWLAWTLTGRADAAWFGWAAVTLSTSQIFHSFTVYPDGVGGVLVLTGVWALVRAQEESESGSERVGPWWLHGAALASLPWIHTRFAILAGSLGGLILLRLATTKNSAAKAVAFLLIPAVSALCWIGFFVAIYGTPDPSAPYGNEEGALSYIPGGLAGLFFDQRFGVLVYAPVLFCAFAGVVVMIRQREFRRLGLELSFVVVPYLLAVTHFAMWWGGTSAPGRFFVPVLLVMVVPAAVGWCSIRHRATRATVCAALGYTAFISSVLVLVGGGRLAFNIRQAYAGWLEWLNGATDLALGTPSWWQGQQITRAGLVRDAAIWISVLVAAWLILRAVESSRWLRSRGAMATAAGAAYAVAVMVSVTIVWTVARAQPINSTPAQLDILRLVSRERHLAAWSLPDFHRIAAAAVPALLHIEPRASEAPGGAGPNDRPLYQVPLVPAGTYRLHVQRAGRSGWVMLGIGRDQFSLSSGPLEMDLPTLNFPVDVRAIIVRGDEQARRAVRTLTIEALSVAGPSERLTADYAKRAVRYGDATVFFLDDRSFPEPEAFWVGGRRTSTLALQTDRAGSSITLLLRNAPVENRVVLESGRWRDDMQLAAGEERRVSVPIDPERRVALLTATSSGGFRPSAVDPRSRDDRFLGVWVRVMGE